jgi:hypothetical protein
MSKTYRRPPIKQHKELLEDLRYTARVEKSKKKEKKNKHPHHLLKEILESESEIERT